MSHNSRRALFYALFLSFLILGTGIALFAQGWRIDFPSFRISKVGGIYVRSYPEDAKIFLNGKSIENQSGFLSRGTLISELFPKTYHLTITAPNYDDWHENVIVFPSLVANHQYAVLVPANATSVTTDLVTGFGESPTNGIVLRTSNGEIIVNGKVVGSGKLIFESLGLQSIVFQTTRGTYEFANIQADTVTNLSNMLSRGGFDTTAPELFLAPLTNTVVFAENPERAGLFDMTQFTNTEIDVAPKGQTIALTAAVSPSMIAWARSANQSSSSSLLFYNPSSGTITSTTVMLGGRVKTLGWVTNNLLGILADSGGFYLYDMNQQNLQKLADDVLSFSVTADGSRIATLESNSLEIFTLNDPNGYYRFNLPNVSDAQTTLWYDDNDHLFIAYSNRVVFLDLEDVNLTNLITVSSGTAPQYDPQTDILYLINPQNHLLGFNFSK